MKATPSLNFTIVKPEHKSLRDFVTMLRSVYQNLVNVVNGNLGFGDGTNTDNISGAWINVVAPGGANTDFTVTHNLNRLPVGYWVMQKDRACDVYTGSVAATKTQLTLRASVASAVLRLFVVVLLFGMIAARGEAQGASHRDFAAVVVNTSAGAGLLKPVPSAVITVCNGATLPAAGSTCTGTASVFSDVGLTQAISNPFNADIRGNYTFFASPGQNYVVSVGGSGVTTYSYVWIAPVVSGGTFTSLISATANPALTGSIRLASSDFIAWRNFANTGDITLKKQGVAVGQLPTDTIFVNPIGQPMYIPVLLVGSSSTGTAATGAIRMGTSEIANWRNFANNGDVGIGLSGAVNGNRPADTFITNGVGSGGWLANFYSDATTTAAVTGQFRLANTSAINWRNFANNADVGIGLTGASNANRPADTFVPNGGSGGWWANFYSESSLTAATAGQVRLSTTGTINWRNNANSADLSLGHNSSDQLTWSNGTFTVPSGGTPTTLTFLGGVPSSGNQGGGIAITGGNGVSSGGGVVNINGGNGVGTNQPGGNAFLTAGNSTGNAVGSVVQIRAGDGGATGNGGNVVLTPGVGSGGGANGIVSITAGVFYFYPSSITFAFLGTPANGALIYCSDCTIANPCAGAGTGAMAKRLNGVWVCN